MREKLEKYLNSAKINYDKRMVDRFIKYHSLLIEWNKKINLTAITDEEEIIVKHYIDSLSIQKYIGTADTFADVGTGAGFPGIPLKITGFKGKIVLMDALNKRVKFLNRVIEELELENCKAIHIRAEDAGRGKYRKKFDVVTARAVAALPVLCEYCIPLVKKGGLFIAMKGPGAEQELKLSKHAIGKLGGKVKSLVKIEIEDYERQIIIIEKIKDTPQVYPRKAGMPKKKPL